MNIYLDSMQSKVYDAKQKLVDTGQVITASAIIEIVTGAEQRKRGLMALFKEHNDSIKKMIGRGVAKGTWTNFNTTFRHTTDFLQTQFQTSEVNILTLNLDFVKRMYNWLRTEKKLGHNSTLKHQQSKKDRDQLCRPRLAQDRSLPEI